MSGQKQPELLDCVVVGAGVEGSASAYHLVKQGLRTLLLEQFPLPHSRGSSHGQSRITRRAYHKGFYTKMMADAFPLWQQLEQEAKTELYKKTGCLSVGQVGSSAFQDTEAALAGNKATYRKLSPEEFKREYPMLTYDPDVGAIWDPDGGILRADKAVQSLQAVFKQRGGILKDGEPVKEIVPGQEVVVTTTKGSYRTRRLVLAPGPWASRLLSPLGLQLPLKTLRISVFYWRERQKGRYTSPKFPTFIDFGGSVDKGHFYTLPAEEYPGYVKVCLHTGPEIQPDHRDGVDREWVKKTASSYVSKHFPQLESEPGVEEACIYTMTPDEDPIIDKHPKWENIVIACGFSGHGFKLAPAVGKLVSEMVTGKKPSYDTAPFKMSRFPSVSKSLAKL